MNTPRTFTAFDEFSPYYAFAHTNDSYSFFGWFSGYRFTCLHQYNNNTVLIIALLRVGTLFPPPPPPHTDVHNYGFYDAQQYNNNIIIVYMTGQYTFYIILFYITCI